MSCVSYKNKNLIDCQTKVKCFAFPNFSSWKQYSEKVQLNRTKLGPLQFRLFDRWEFVVIATKNYVKLYFWSQTIITLCSEVMCSGKKKGIQKSIISKVLLHYIFWESIINDQVDYYWLGFDYKKFCSRVSKIAKKSIRPSRAGSKIIYLFFRELD